jgi:hypothetical protein
VGGHLNALAQRSTGFGIGFAAVSIALYAYGRGERPLRFNAQSLVSALMETANRLSSRTTKPGRGTTVPSVDVVLARSAHLDASTATH